MAITLQQIQHPISEDEALEWVLQVLTELGFSARSWQQGSVPLTFATLFAKGYAGCFQTIAAYSYMGFNETSTNTALSAFSRSHYDNSRVAATRTQGTVRLTNASGAPHVVTASQLLFKDVNNSFSFRNLTGGTIPAGGTLDVTVEAEVAGSDRNVALNTITVMTTTLTGVTCTNPDVGGGTWITSEGTDVESDTVLRARNRGKWSTRTYASPPEAYEQFALESSENIARVGVDDSNPGGPGTVHVYIAGAAGASAAGDVTDAQDYTDDRIPITSDCTVYAAVADSQNLGATIYIEASKNTLATQTAVEQAATDYINGLPVGGKVLTGVTGYAFHSEIVTAISSIDGVENVSLITPAADVAVTMWHILVVGSIHFSYVSV